MEFMEKIVRRQIESLEAREQMLKNSLGTAPNPVQCAIELEGLNLAILWLYGAIGEFASPSNNLSMVELLKKRIAILNVELTKAKKKLGKTRSVIATAGEIEKINLAIAEMNVCLGIVSIAS